MSEGGSTEMIKLKSNDDVVVEVPIEIAKMSSLVDGILNCGDDSDEDDDDDETMKKQRETIPLPKVNGFVLKKIVEFCEHYQTEEMTPIEAPSSVANIEDLVQKWYVEFDTNLNQQQLFEVVTFANFMDIKELLNLAVLGVSFLCKYNVKEILFLIPVFFGNFFAKRGGQGKNPDELREIFGVTKE